MESEISEANSFIIILVREKYILMPISGETNPHNILNWSRILPPDSVNAIPILIYPEIW